MRSVNVGPYTIYDGDDVPFYGQGETIIIGDDNEDDHEATHAVICDEDNTAIFSIAASGLFAAGFGFGICLIPETRRLFLGSGMSIECYDLDHRQRIWQEAVTVGFHRWTYLANFVFMEAELEFAAWSHDGTKLWATFVEPPWSWHRDGDTVVLEVMKSRTQFSMAEGPPSDPWWQ